VLRKAKKRHGETRHRPWPLSERPGFLIRRLHQIHVALFQDACGEFEVTPLQYSLLSALAARKTADQTTLAADIALDRTTTTGALGGWPLATLSELMTRIARGSVDDAGRSSASGENRDLGAGRAPCDARKFE
jgi:hypothetical protein